jgi:serine/threonine protein kinase
MDSIDSKDLMSNIEIKKKIGKGAFGEVFIGLWNGTTDIAMKKLNQTENKNEFIKESNLLK